MLKPNRKVTQQFPQTWAHARSTNNKLNKLIFGGIHLRTDDRQPSGADERAQSFRHKCQGGPGEPCGRTRRPADPMSCHTWNKNILFKL